MPQHGTGGAQHWIESRRIAVYHHNSRRQISRCYRWNKEPRNHVGMRNSVEGEALPKMLLGRVLLKHVGAVCRDGIHAGICYQISSIGVIAKANLDILELMACGLKTIRGPW